MFKKFFTEWIFPSSKSLSMKKNIIRFINVITVIGIIAH